MDSFNITSGKIQVTDPCYSIGTWCSFTIPNAKNGEYISSVKRINDGVWGNRIAELNIIHKDFKNKKRKLKYRWIDASIGVDSGQAGFFDFQEYHNVKINEQLDNEFYNKVCNLTCEADNNGTLDFGVVSSSGHGDGSYALWVAHINDEVVAAKIVFIDEENE